jgi:SWI/SNF-related matrix-associated actin-dependent regulator 1 of chromatin subfamily A
MIYIQEKKTVKIPGITSLFISFDFNRAIVDELKLISNSFFNPDTKEWEIPLTSLAEFIDRVCVHDSITLETMPDSDITAHEYELMEYKTKPFDYQREGIQFGLNSTSWLLLDAPGLGKTLQLTYLAEELKLRQGLQHCLIICGINTLKTNWKNEIEKHSNLSCRILGQRITKKGNFVVDGIQERLKQLKEPIEEFFVITNVETLREDKIVQALLKNKYNKFDMIVVDEVHRMKNPNSQQGKNFLKLNKAKYKVGATGTLLLNNPLDAYVPLKWIGAERANYSTFRYYYCNYGGPFGNMLVGFKNIQVLQDQIKKYSLRRTKDILNLPPKNVIHEYVDMSDAQSIFYDNVKAGVAQEVNKVKLNAANVLSLVARLRQATACPSILTTESIPSAKMDRAEDLVEQIVGSGYKVVIFSTFKQTVYELAQRLRQYKLVVATGDQSDAEIEAAKQALQEDPDTKIFIGTWQKCGTGITLTAASYMIFIDTPWTDADFCQASDRIHRIGTKDSVFIYNLVTRGTVDERVLELVTDKAAIADYIVDEKITPQGLDSLRKYIEDII